MTTSEPTDIAQGGKPDKAGLHADGNGLYLRISNGRTAGRRWVFVYHFNGKRREMGLGSAATVTLAEARAKAREARSLLDNGEDPLAQGARQAGGADLGTNRGHP